MEDFIKIVLKQVHPNTEISDNAATYIQDILLNLVPRMDASKILARLPRGSIQTVISGELGKHAHSEGQKAANPRTKLVFTPEWAQSVFSSQLPPQADRYLAMVFEYLTAEILELSGNAARDRSSVQIEKPDVQKAIQADDELQLLFKVDRVEPDIDLFSLFEGESRDIPASSMEELLQADLYLITKYTEEGVRAMLERWNAEDEVRDFLWIVFYSLEGRFDKVIEYSAKHALDFDVTQRNKIIQTLADSPVVWNEEAVSLMERQVFNY